MQQASKPASALAKVTVDEHGVLTPEQKQRVWELLARYVDCFATNTKAPSATHLVELSIELLEGAKPVKHPPSRVGSDAADIIREQCAAMLKDGIISPSHSEFQSRVVLVTKKDGTKRFCVDYRDLNTRIVNHQVPLPNINQALDPTSPARGARGGQAVCHRRHP